MAEGKNLVGVDIGSTAIKVVEIREGRTGARSLVRFGHHPLPPQTIVDGHVMNTSAVVEGLEKLFHRQKARDVALRASGHSVIIKKIVMPIMTAAELQEQIGWEAEQHIPFDREEVYVDHQVLRRRQDEGQMDVLLVAAKREEIGDVANLATEAKLRPRVVDLDVFCLQNVFEVGYGAVPHEETIVLAHVGASMTSLNVLAGGTTSFTRDIANGGNAITEEIQRQLNVSVEEAEAFKCGSGSGPVPKQAVDVVTQMVAGLAGEIQRSLDFYLATSGDRELSRVYLSGGTAALRALQEAVEQRARVRVEVLDPFKAAPPDGSKVNLASLTERVAQVGVAAGLALRKDRERRA